MIGCLKLTPTGVIARSGFKYIRFSPQMTILQQRGVVIYKDIGYEYDDDTLYVSFDDSDISKETMSAIVVSNCTILNKKCLTGRCSTNTGNRSVVLTERFEICPIVERQYKGRVTDRYDIQIYANDNYIKFDVQWDKDSISKTITSSLSNIDEKLLWEKLEESHPKIFNFLDRSERSASHLFGYPLQTRELLNVDHFNRFKNRYGSDFKINYDEDLEKYKSIDVIDLCNITEIKIDTKDFLSKYSVYEILPNTIVHKGEGLTSELLDSLSDKKDKFYVMLVNDSINHSIKKHTFITLYINTKVLTPVSMEDDFDTRPELVFLKFNKVGLKRWLANNIISQL